MKQNFVTAYNEDEKNSHDILEYVTAALYGAFHIADLCRIKEGSYFSRIDFTSATASAVISLILSNSPALIRSPFTIQLPPHA